MENIKEKLEISKWLYEQGLEPDWYCAHRNSTTALLDTKTTRDEGFDSENPCFTLKRVLELLPVYLDYEIEESYDHFGGTSSNETYILRIIWGIDCEGVGYHFDTHQPNYYENHVNDHECDLYVSCIEPEDIDHELAALKLLKKVIETYGKEILNGK